MPSGGAPGAAPGPQDDEPTAPQRDSPWPSGHGGRRRPSFLMNVLAIETSTEQLGVALVDEARVLASYELLAEHPHAIELPAAVTRVLEAAGTPLHDIEALAVDIGPGSFTGLRIGIAFVKALAFCRSPPTVSVPSLMPSSASSTRRSTEWRVGRLRGNPIISSSALRNSCPGCATAR